MFDYVELYLKPELREIWVTFHGDILVTNTTIAKQSLKKEAKKLTIKGTCKKTTRTIKDSVIFWSRAFLVVCLFVCFPHEAQSLSSPCSTIKALFLEIVL